MWTRGSFGWQDWPNILREKMPLDIINPLKIYRSVVSKLAVFREDVTDQQNAPLPSLKFCSVFHNYFCLYMFLTGGFIFRQTAVTTTGKGLDRPRGFLGS